MLSPFFSSVPFFSRVFLTGVTLTLEDRAELVSRRDAACRASPRLGTSGEASSRAPSRIRTRSTTAHGRKASSYDGYCLAVAWVRHGTSVLGCLADPRPRMTERGSSTALKLSGVEVPCLLVSILYFAPIDGTCSCPCSSRSVPLSSPFSPGVPKTSCFMLVEPGSLNFSVIRTCILVAHFVQHSFFSG